MKKKKTVKQRSNGKQEDYLTRGHSKHRILASVVTQGCFANRLFFFFFGQLTRLISCISSLLENQDLRTELTK